MSTYTQDLPPKEGYGPIQIKRIPLRNIIGGRKAILICLASTIVGHYIYYLEWKTIKRHDIEMKGANLALKALLVAERDRAFLKQLKRNVAEEKHLMRYYPSWKVGTFFGEPIYKTIPEDKFVEPDCYELYAHADYGDYLKRFIHSTTI